jgi:hypothetical protein
VPVARQFEYSDSLAPTLPQMSSDGEEEELENLLLVSYVNSLADSDEDEEVTLTQVAAAIILGGAIEARERRQAARRRLYLTRPELLRNPRQDTPWQTLYASRNDRAFITTMGLDVATFHHILDHAGFARRWDTRPIPRPDVQSHGNPRLGRRSVDASAALGLALHWLNSTMREVSLQQIFALVPSTVNRYNHAAIDNLLNTLRSMPEAEISWPVGERFEELAKIVRERHSLLLKAFGVVDGLNLPVQVSGDEEMQNAMYNGWLHGHFVSNVIVFGPTGA